MNSISRILALLLLGSAPLSFHAGAATPPAVVIDIHTHIFNAHDIPIGGVMRAQGIPLSVLGPVVEFLMAGTQDYAPASGPSTELFSPGDFGAPLAIPEADKAAIRSYVGQSQVRRFTPLQTELSLSDGRQLDEESMALTVAVFEAANIPPAENTLTPDAQLRVSPANALAFVALMRKSQLTIAERLRADFPGVNLFVHHLMDLGSAYGDQPANPFPAQMQRFDALEADPAVAGHFLHFTAFDPFRGDAALDVIREPGATQLRGRALGVKFYPPSGYRPAENDIETKPSWLAPARRAQWASRYEALGATMEERNTHLDAICDRFFDFCEQQQIPVFAHCTGFGFQAVSGYGMNCNPKYWRTVLVRHPLLRLCLAHAGGEPWWFSAGEKPDPGLGTEDQERWNFGRDVVQLCIDYPNVYTEVGYLDAVLEPGEKRNRLVARLKEVAPATGKAPGVQFGRKIMYGTDWHMIYKEKNYPRYLDAFTEIFADPALQPLAARFFAGTAVEFLNLSAVANDLRFSLAQRNALHALLAQPP